MKTLFLVVGLVLGFSGGIYLGVHHPQMAQSFSDQEAQWVLKGKQQATQTFSAKLDKILKNSSTASATPGSSFLGGGTSRVDTDSALRNLQSDTKSDLSDIEKQLDNAKK